MHDGMIFWIVIGGVAGWLGGIITKGGGFGLFLDILLGIIGAFVGGWLARVLGVDLGAGWLGSLITATVGAVLILFLTRLIKRD